MNIKWIITFWSLLKLVNCEFRSCCQGENIIKSKECVEGFLNETISCSHKILLKKEDVDYFDEAKNIVTFGTYSPPKNSFCQSTVNGTGVFIVCYEPDDFEEPSDIYIFLGFISAFFLFLTIAIYLSLPKLLDVQGICVIHSILGLACGFVILGVNRLSDSPSTIVCHFYAYSLYFSFLYTFFWLNTYCFHLWRTTIQPKFLEKMTSWHGIYYLYSCGFPILLLSVVIFSQYSDMYMYIHPRMAEESICWFGTLEASFVYLYVPISILLSMNVIYFFWTIYGLWREVHKYDGKRMKILRYRLSLCVKMFFVMGISWIFEVFSAAFEHKYPSVLWHIPDAINSLQGILIFLIMVVLRKRVYRLLAEKPLGKILPPTWKSIDADEEASVETEDDYKLDRVTES